MIDKVYTYEDYFKNALYPKNNLKYNWIIASLETGFYSIAGVPCIALGDSEGFFTESEIEEIGIEFSKMDNPSIPRHPNEIEAVEKGILSKALTLDRFEEYKKLKWRT